MDRIQRNIEQLVNAKYDTLLEMTFGDLLDAQAARFPDHDCLVDPHKGRRFTYAQFREECDRVARGLMAIGVRPGDHVA
ncbi:MAG: AMP-binding protein, partial [Christensenellales bacterium]